MAQFKRPKSVTMLVLGVLTLSGLNLVRFYQALRQFHFLSQLIPVSPLYILSSGLFWGVVGLVLVLALWRGLHWAPLVLRLVSLAYFVYYWCDRLLVAGPENRNLNGPFAAVSTIVILVLIQWILSRRKVKDFYWRNT